MYAFAQRSDTRVLDEPLYGHYLRVTDAAHPEAHTVLDAMDTDALGNALASTLRNEALRSEMSRNAHRHASRFGLEDRARGGFSTAFGATPSS